MDDQNGAKITIDIDTGGTFTDGFLTWGERAEKVKVDTTPHDLTVCFIECIKQGARTFGLPLEKMLANTAVIRYSTTVGTNAIIQKSGPKLGLLTTRSFASDLGHLAPFIAPNMIIELDEEMDGTGRELRALDEEQARLAIEQLLDQGARIIVVSLLNSYVNPAHEWRVKAIVNGEYPRHYLGSVPVLLASEVSTHPGDVERTNTAVLSAYLRRDLVRYLYKADEDLRRAYYDRPLLVAHSTGGVARVAKTTAINTYNSGPVSGLVGCALVANKLYSETDFVSVDVGGTSVDIGIVGGGQWTLNDRPAIEGVAINMPMIEVGAVGGGGGSIVKVRDGGIAVGPESAGALPGPIAYDLGGTEPTVTDADLVLGYLNADYFLGGRRKLNKDKAVRAIWDRVASRLGLSVEETAWRVVRTVEENTARAIEAEVAKRGRGATDFTLFAFGGAGGLRCCGYAERLGLRRVRVFAFNPVFSAFGASTLDVQHLYEEPMALALRTAGGQYAGAAAMTPLSEAIARLRATGLRDMRGEGFAQESVAFSAEVELGDGNGHRAVVALPALAVAGEADARRLCQTFAKQTGADNRGRQVTIDRLRLRALCPTPHYEHPSQPMASSDPAGALKGVREVFWGQAYTPTNVYERNRLGAGNVVTGPAIIEAEDTTYLVPPSWRYTVDQYLNGLLEVK